MRSRSSIVRFVARLYIILHVLMLGFHLVRPSLQFPLELELPQTLLLPSCSRILPINFASHSSICSILFILLRAAPWVWLASDGSTLGQLLPNRLARGLSPARQFDRLTFLFLYLREEPSRSSIPSQKGMPRQRLPRHHRGSISICRDISLRNLSPSHGNGREPEAFVQIVRILRRTRRSH